MTEAGTRGLPYQPNLPHSPSPSGTAMRHRPVSSGERYTIPAGDTSDETAIPHRMMSVDYRRPTGSQRADFLHRLRNSSAARSRNELRRPEPS